MNVEGYGKGSLYRYEDTAYSRGVDEWDNPLPGYDLRLTLVAFSIIKETPCGVWIEVWGGRKFVRMTANKRYACRTKEEAFESFRKRKERQVLILKGQLKRAQDALALTLWEAK